MRILSLTVVLFTTISSSSLLAQKSESWFQQYGVSYFGDMGIYPGINLFAGRVLTSQDFARGKKNKRDILRELSFRPSLRLMTHPRVNRVINPVLGMNYAMGRKTGVYANFDFGLGYWLQINKGNTYILEDGEAVAIGSTSRGYLSSELSLGLGIRTSKAFNVWAKTSFAQQIPYTSVGILPRVILQIGFTKTINKR